LTRSFVFDEYLIREIIDLTTTFIAGPSRIIAGKRTSLQIHLLDAIAGIALSVSFCIAK
jgi:hypothetical protein